MTNNLELFPNFETSNFILRGLQAEDVDFYFQHYSDPYVVEHNKAVPPIRSLEQAKWQLEWFMDPANDTFHQWLVIRKADDVKLGTASIMEWKKEHAKTRIRYDLQPLNLCEDDPLEILTPIIKNAFEVMKVHRLESVIYEHDYGRIKDMEKAGFQREGLMRDYYCQNAEFFNYWFFSRLQTDA